MSVTTECDDESKPSKIENASKVNATATPSLRTPELLRDSSPAQCFASNRPINGAAGRMYPGSFEREMLKKAMQKAGKLRRNKVNESNRKALLDRAVLVTRSRGSQATERHSKQNWNVYQNG